MHNVNPKDILLMVENVAKQYQDILQKKQNPLGDMMISLTKLFYEILSKTSAQLFKDPFKLSQKIFTYQLKIIQCSFKAKNANELIQLLHQELLNCCIELIKDIELDKKDRMYFIFCIKQFFYAFDPENFIFSNTKALARCIESRLENIMQGARNFKNDLLKNSIGPFATSNIDKKSFFLGQNIAATQGKVIYKNSIIELICYKPEKQVSSIPILIVPPCINKYYILDLSESNSFVRWLVSNNFQVFILSWVNPKSVEQNFSFEQYLELGILESAQYIIKKFNYQKLNTVGYCIGGTMLATILGYCAKRKINIFNSVTFFNTLLDFENIGELSMFIRKETIEHFKKLSDTKGYLDGMLLHNFFNLLKSKELIWSTYVKNYLEGRSPKAFDILYWNSDYANLPSSMFEFYLEKLCLSNLLVQPNKILILGSKIDLSKIKIPLFCLASKNDHIVPWEQSYKGMYHLGGEKNFCLTDAGHVAGVLNHPQMNKYNYWSGKIQEDSKLWLSKANIHKGSWWLEHLNWLKKYSGEMEKSLEYSRIKSLGKAPGSFCRE